VLGPYNATMALKRFFLMLLLLSLIGCSSPEVSIEDNSSQKDDFELTLVKDVEGIDASEVLSFTCELITAKPEEATPYCADFGVAIWDIKWSSWEATGAIGKGLYRANDCEPSCAEGTIFEAPVDLKLQDLYTDGARYFLRTLTFSSEKPLPLSQESMGTWDLAEFYIEVPGMRSEE
jgi:hypothetical protein